MCNLQVFLKKVKDKTAIMTHSMLRRQLKNLVQNFSEAEVKVSFTCFFIAQFILSLYLSLFSVFISLKSTPFKFQGDTSALLLSLIFIGLIQSYTANYAFKTSI